MNKQEIVSDNAPKPIGPYSQAIIKNDTLFLSGQIPLNPLDGEILRGDIKDQTNLVMSNIKALVIEAGFNMSDVVKTSIFISDMKQFGEINEVYSQYFSFPYPARETVQVACLPKNVDVEISIIAMK